MPKPKIFEVRDGEEEFVHEGTGGTVQESHLENLDSTFRRIIISSGDSEPTELWSYGGKLGNVEAREEAIERARKIHMGEDDGMEVVKID